MSRKPKLKGNISVEDILKQAAKDARKADEPDNVELSRDDVAMLALGESVEIEELENHLIIKMEDE